MIGDNPPVSASTHAALNHIWDVQRRIADLHPFLADLGPIALVQGDVFQVFEPGAGGYRFVTSVPVPMPIPQGVRAAFPIDALDGRAACVVTPDAFDSAVGTVEIFHEFIHCHQWANGEQALRESLALARKAQAENDPRWELAYPFPYADSAVSVPYRRWMAALETGDAETASSQRCALRSRLSDLDWEYATWQEWKEGLARYVENLIRPRLGLPPNRNGCDGALSRVSFYAGGAAFIALLGARTPALLTDLPALFDAIRESPPSS